MNQKGLSLVEILISLVISSIIIAASFASYTVISRNFDFQKEMKSIAQSSRAVVEIIKRDVRLGGFVYDNNTAITKPIVITEGGSSASDRIDIIYDQDKNKRIKVSYYTVTVKPMTAFERRRLMKTILQCTVAQCGSGNTIMSPQPIADYVEDLQFTGYKNGNVLGNGVIGYGLGNMRWVTPSSVSSNCGGVAGNLIDGNTSSEFNGSTSRTCEITINFTNHVRIEKFKIMTAAHLDGGSLGGDTNFPFNAASHPYGTSRHVLVNGTLSLAKSDATCSWSSSCGSFTNADAHSTCVGLLGEIDTLSKNGSGGCAGSATSSTEIGKNATKKLILRITNGSKCTYTGSGQKCQPTTDNSQLRNLAEIQFYGEVYEPQDPQEVEIGLLIRSANEYGSTPIRKTYNIGNRSIVTNDNYIRDSYFTSTLVRNVFYGQ